VVSFSPSNIETTLSDIHDEQVRGVLTGAEYNEFSRLRKAVERELKT
jgi:hypothetical protein